MDLWGKRPQYGAPFIGGFATSDPSAIRDCVQAVEALDYHYLFSGKMLLNENPQEIFHESMSLFAFLGATTI